MRRLLAVVIVAFVCASPAGAANVATPKMAQVASWAAGKPISVHCENDQTAWQELSGRYGYNSPSGFTIFSEPVIYIGPAACAYFSYGDARLGYGLHTLLHESAHQRGFRDEALAECAARLLIYSALHNFYGVPWWSARMSATAELALTYSLSQPAEYQGGCARL